MDLQELTARISRLDTAAICDANKEIRAMDAGIKPIRPDRKMIGFARTASCKDDFLTVLVALSESEPGEILVVDCQAGTRAVAGELFSTEALRRGLGGLVIDGMVRDSPTIRTLDIPVYSRGVHPMAGSTKKILDMQIPVTCGGITVNPGDIVFGDDEGVVVASPRELIELLPSAEEIQRREQAVLARIRGGESLTSMLNLQEHVAAIRAGEDSKLKLA